MFSSIGQFSKLTGVTAKALYLYERRGLLTPRRSRAGYRRYTMRELTQLERIVALKGLGLSLQQIAAMTRDEGRATGLLQQQRAVLDDKRRRLERAVNAIDAIAGDEMPGAALDRFVNESSWDRWEVRLKAAASQAPRAPDRASPSRVALFQKIHAALDRDPRGRKGARARRRMERAPRAGIRRRQQHGGVETAALGGPSKLACRHAQLRRVPVRHGMAGVGSRRGVHRRRDAEIATAKTAELAELIKKLT